MVDQAGAVRPNVPSAHGMSSDEPILISPGPDLALNDISTVDGDPDVSQSDDTLLPLALLIESVMREQPSSKSSAGKPPLVNWIG